MSTLVIVESPAKCKSISKYLGNGYVVKASFGHIRDLPQKELGVDLNNGYTPEYKNMPEKSKIIKDLKEYAKKSDKVLLASDPDREGEAIAWHLNYILKNCCKNIRRITFNEITKPAVTSATKNERDIDLNMVNSQQARRILDRIVGYKISPLLNKIIDSDNSLSAGRVQSVTLKIIVQREKDINNFQKEEYWTITAVLDKDDTIFSADLFAYNGEKIKVKDSKEAQSVLNNLKDAIYTVSKVDKQERKRGAAAPFTTSTLQQESNKKLGWDSSKTMKIAQELYEGIDLGNDQRSGLITYMRTDSTRVSEEYQKIALDYIKDTFGSEYVPDKPNIYKTKGEAQDAHEAIRPTVIANSPDKIKEHLSLDQYNLYKLIYEKFISSQMAPAIYDTVSVVVSANNYDFKATGNTLKFDGFTKIYTDAKEDENKEDENDEKKLPILAVGDTPILDRIEPKQKFTTPPPKFTEASLIKELEKLGIGRPSTYATIISVLKKRKYISLSGKKFIPTELGVKIVDFLEDKFENIMQVDFTANMETNLDIIADGKKNWVSVLDDFCIPFLDNLNKVNQEVYEKMEETYMNCPTCGKPMVKKKGPYGYFLACTGYPDCTTKKACDKDGNVIEKKQAELTDIMCPECGKPMILRNGKTGKFYGCSNYPTCKKTMPYIDKDTETETCPECGKPMILRSGKSGKFWGCTGYPDCTQTKPYIDPKAKTKTCPECGKPMVLRNGKSGKFWGCTGYPDCKHTEQEN